jgi:hypothetical protein
LAAQATSNAQKFSPPTCTFRFTYNFTVKDIPSGAKRVRVWIPVPQTTQHQTVRVLAVKGFRSEIPFLHASRAISSTLRTGQ